MAAIHIATEEWSKAEKDYGNQQNWVAVAVVIPSIDSNKPQLAFYLENLSTWMRGDWKGMALSPHSKQIDDFQQCKKLVAQARHIAGENKTE